MLITSEIYDKYVHYERKLTGKRASVLYDEDETRIKEAKKQLEKSIVNRKTIIDYTHEFLLKAQICTGDDLKKKEFKGLCHPEMKNIEIKKSRRKCRDKRIANIDYEKIKKENHLNSKKHIIWMKFTKDGYLGVVARSDDVNFDIPPKDCKDYSGYNTSGIIIRRLGKEWNEEEILLFPIPNVGDGEMRDIECGIGEYLIKKEVPILDRFSHTF